MLSVLRLRLAPALFSLLLVTGCFSPNPNDKLSNMPQGTGFTVHAVRSSGEERKYSVFVPRDYSPQKKYPTIIFLHGIGEAGSDGVKCTTVGIGPAIAKRNGNFPFIVVFPQAGWDWTGKEQGQLVVDVLDDASKQFAIDKDRVTLTGMSSGGEGTWVLGARHPDRFAALVPMGGYAATDTVPTLARVHMPVWALHNSGDFIVMVGGTRKMVKMLKDAGLDDDHLKYTEFNAIGHNCWDAAYDEGALFNWLQQQHASAHVAMR